MQPRTSSRSRSNQDGEPGSQRTCRVVQRFSPSPIKRSRFCRTNHSAKHTAEHNSSRNNSNTAANKENKALPQLSQAPPAPKVEDVRARAAPTHATLSGKFGVSAGPKDIEHYKSSSQAVAPEPHTQDEYRPQMNAPYRFGEPVPSSAHLFQTPNQSRKRCLKMSEKVDLTLKKASTHVRDSTTDESPLTTLLTTTPALSKQSTTVPTVSDTQQTTAPLLRKHATAEPSYPPETTGLSLKKQTSVVSHTDKSSAKVGGRWTEAEHRRFLEGIRLFGRDWRQIEAHIGGTRTCSQIRSHAQKYFLRVERLREEHEQQAQKPESENQVRTAKRRSHMLETATYESQMMVGQPHKQQPQPPVARIGRAVDLPPMEAEERLQHLWEAIGALRAERDHYCSSYLMGGSSAQDFCIALDTIGKRAFSF